MKTVFRKCSRFSALLLAALLLLSGIPFASAAGLASGKITAQSDALPSSSQKLTDGIYNIVNKESGEYIDVYDLAFDADGSSILNEKTGEDGQSFLIRLRDDGTYALYPQNDGGKYALCYSPDILVRHVLSKTDASSRYTGFKLTPVSGGSFLISPAFTIDSDIVLGISSQKTYLGHHYVGMEVFNGENDQKWEFVRVGSHSLDVSTTFLTVKTGGTARLYGVTTPSYLADNLVWTSENKEIATVDADGTVHGVKAGKTVVHASLDGVSVSAEIAVTDLKAFAWFSQHNITGGGWYASAVANLYLRADGMRKIFFINGYNRNADWMDEGCKISSIAMVLRNLGARVTKGYDIRTGQTDLLEADPFTAVLASSGSDGRNFGGTLAYSPVVAVYGNLSSRFRVDGKAISSSISTDVSRASLKKLLDEHPEGVVVDFKNYARDISHSVVFTECVNPDADPSEYEFRICDPASPDPADGNNVLFTESYSYKTIGYRYGNMVSVLVYDVVG